MTALAIFLCAMTLAADPPPAEPSAGAGAPWGGAAAAASGPASAAPEDVRITWGLEVLVPKKDGGRLLERPVALVVELGRRLGGGFEGAIHGSLGHAQLSRTEACISGYDCRPLIGVALGGVLRVTTPPNAAVVAWLGLGGGFSGAINVIPGWDVNVIGLYGRADAGVDLRAGDRRLRLSAGWVQAAYTEIAPERDPGRQRYLAFTLVLGPR